MNKRNLKGFEENKQKYESQINNHFEKYQKKEFELPWQRMLMIRLSKRAKKIRSKGIFIPKKNTQMTIEFAE